MNDYSPAGIAASKRSLAAEITETDFKQWQHQPISQMFFQYMADLVEVSRRNIADFVENGTVDATNENQLRNLHCLRGQISILRQIGAIDTYAIKNFYDDEATKAEQDDQ